MSGPLAGFEVRPARERDLPRVVELDRLAFGAAGMGHYGEPYVRCWMEVRVARWYVLECAAQYGGGVWPQVRREALELPPPAAPDPVLNKYLKDPGAGVAAVLEGWIEDPASRNCSALVAIAGMRG